MAQPTADQEGAPGEPSREGNTSRGDLGARGEAGMSDQGGRAGETSMGTEGAAELGEAHGGLQGGDRA